MLVDKALAILKKLFHKTFHFLWNIKYIIEIKTLCAIKMKIQVKLKCVYLFLTQFFEQKYMI